MTIRAIFKSRIPNIQYIFKSGKSAPFLGGRYTTDVDTEIDELMAEIVDVGVDKSRHPHIYVDEAESEIDSEAETPIQAIRRKAVEEYIASQAVAMDKSKLSKSTQNTGGIVGAANSENTAALYGNSNSSDGAVSMSAKLDSMKTGK